MGGRRGGGRHRPAHGDAPRAALALTAIEFDLLAALVRHRQRVVSKHELLAEVWGYGAGDYDDHVVEVHVSALRAKLEAHGPRIIDTVRGAGYVLRPPNGATDA